MLTRLFRRIWYYRRPRKAPRESYCVVAIRSDRPRLPGTICLSSSRPIMVLPISFAINAAGRYWQAAPPPYTKN